MIRDGHQSYVFKDYYSFLQSVSLYTHPVDPGMMGHLNLSSLRLPQVYARHYTQYRTRWYLCDYVLGLYPLVARVQGVEPCFYKV